MGLQQNFKRGLEAGWFKLEGYSLKQSFWNLTEKKMKEANMLMGKEEKYVYSSHAEVLESTACLET